MISGSRAKRALKTPSSELTGVPQSVVSVVVVNSALFPVVKDVVAWLAKACVPPGDRKRAVPKSAT